VINLEKMKNQLMTFLLTWLTFCGVCGDSDDVEESVNNKIHELNSFRSAEQKYLLDTSYLDLLNATEIEFQVITPMAKQLFSMLFQVCRQW